MFARSLSGAVRCFFHPLILRGLLLSRETRFAKMPAIALRPVASMAKSQVVRPAKAQKPAKVNLGAAAAAIAAAALLVAPVNAADIKTVVCASNPTAKICLKDSGKP